jgi:hypothetical protein
MDSKTESDLLRQVAARYGREAREAAKSSNILSADQLTAGAISTTEISGNSIFTSGIGNYPSYAPYTLGQYHTNAVITGSSNATVKKAPRVCDELDSLASLSAVEYSLIRQPDGINIVFAHEKKHVFNMLVAEVHLEAAFRSALQLYLLPYFDRSAK